MSKTINLNKLMSSPNPHRALIEETKGLIRKWEPTGLLEGLDSEAEVSGMSILLENQSKQVIEESSKTGGTDAEAWAGVALPLVRRIFGEIAAKEFVSVQPMTLPAGLVFYLDFKYARGTTQPGFPSGSSVFGGSNITSDVTNMQGGTNPTWFGKTDVAQNGLYGAGRFGFSQNDKTASFTTSGSGVGLYKVTNLSGDAGYYAIGYTPELSASVATGQLYALQFNMSGLGIDTIGVRGFGLTNTATLATANGNYVTYYPALTSWALSASVDTVTFVVSASSAPTSSFVVNYFVQPTKETRGDFEDSSYLFNYQQLDIPEIDLQFRSEPIVAKTRKLKAVWTPEMAQDLNAFHSVDAEAELTSMLSEYISMEIDLEILDMLIQNALTTDYWSARIGYEFDSGLQKFTAPASTVGQFYTKQTWFQTLGVKVQKVSNKIHQLTMRGGANFMVVGPTVATILESIPGYSVDTNGDKQQFAMGVSKIGSLGSRWNVYKNPYMLENVILLGFRGSQFLETGAVYAPYVPLVTTPLIYDPNNLTPRKGVMTRYAKRVLRPEFFGRIVIDGLQTL